MRGTNPMGDVSPLINDEPLPLPGTTAKGDQIRGLVSAGWTNERHSTYISSMEASFMDQLYGVRKHDCNDEFKVIQETKTNAPPHDGGGQPANTWVRRSRTHSSTLNRGDVKEASIDDYGSGTDSVKKKVHTYGREAKTSAEGNLIDKSKEVSDQNFSEDFEANDEPCKRRRPRSTSAEPNDQPTQ